MRSLIVVLALSGMLTVEQRDSRRGELDPPAAALSEDARYIAFTTFARLAPADDDDRRDVYVLDRIEQRVTLESAALEGFRTSPSSHPVLSGDGNMLAYETAGHIVVRDRTHGTSLTVAAGRQPAISGNGRVVAFTSDGIHGVCVFEVERQHTQCIGGDALGGVSPALTGDGRHLAFSALGSVFVHDRTTGAMTRVAAGWDPAISADGNWVAFVSLVRGMPTVMLIDRHTGSTQIVSRSMRGGRASGRSANPAISRDGRIVAFQSEASNMVDDEDYNLLWDVFLFDRETGFVARVSGDHGDAGWFESSGGPALDGTGTVVAFSSRHPTDASDKANDFDLFVAPVDVRAAEALPVLLRQAPDPAASRARIRGAR